MKKLLSITLSIMMCVVLIFSTSQVLASETTQLPFTLELQESNGDLSDYVEIDFASYEVKGTHIGIKLNPEHAIDQNGNVPAWSMFHFTFFDELGNTYTSARPTDVTTSNPEYAPAFTEKGNYVDITWGYSHLWPKLGFYGTIYLPIHKLNIGSLDNKTSINAPINKIRIQHNSKSNARKEMITHFFEIVDATLELPGNEEKWIGDVLILEDFDTINAKDSVNIHGQILDFTKIDPSNVTLSQDAKMFARKMTQIEYDNLLSSLEDTNVKDWQSKYSVTGQKFSYTPFDNGIYNTGFKWQYGSYLTEYDSNLNSYGSFNIKVDHTDWKNALGLTLWFKNPQNYPVSFNLEFAESENGGLERWNLNNDYYRKIYAYDVNTGEEFAFHSLVVAEVPANFEGWLRIPFAEYEVPSWSLNNEWSDGKLDLNKPHTNIYITSQFIKNDSVTMYFDNVGIYFEDFQVGKLFDRKLPSIKDCLEMTNYQKGGK